MAVCTQNFLHGIGGYISKGGVPVVGITEWNIVTEHDVVETVTQRAWWAENLEGVTRWSGSFAAFFDLTIAEQRQMHNALVQTVPAGCQQTVRFYPETGYYYGGDIIITRVETVASAEDGIRLNIDFVGTGALTTPAYS